jgi:hypothetical protein
VGVGLSDVAFEGEQFVLHGLDFVEVELSLFLGEFVDAVEQ